jgi:hypothetical protein
MESLRAIGCWLYNWQTLAGSIIASISAIFAGWLAWRAVMMQIAAAKSERNRRTDYALALAKSYLLAVRRIIEAVKIQEKRLAMVTEEQWRVDHTAAPALLAKAEMAFTEPISRTRMGDVESYREELPLFLSNDLSLVFRLENNLADTIAELHGQQRVPCSFPIQDCQKRLRDAIEKLETAIEAAESSCERFKYE